MQSDKRRSDVLFASLRNPHGAPISDNHYRGLIKAWAAVNDLDTADYSTHSLRRTKPVWMWRHGDRRAVTITVLQLPLGNKSPESTVCYLGLDVLKVQDIALTKDLFATGTNPKPRPRMNEQ